ncbi:uncharacterized protein LACBIDRAFT_305892 [Laccaria bicolor S238N-H82]|uniref:Predicted protein n=1 Tax=Laccaria bicolor (strain S238N-H82 / ATCC MYA-4686) TaxID=486041 RepID=B0CS67_LACBS|nr:uncharacterized protein LACBIDRAFT_305892 [Laccaria bicolor S238N-H82]EDR14794.1 predicted protein [Laccaria bicolor S238N-H82]|eukprot:XP_001875353.1 predicted protein [Laccaria bicolor S238N-H82]
MSSEHHPLLPTSHAEQHPSKYHHYRDKTAELLESPRLHKLVIALIATDAVCVLIDLGYTVLSTDCTPVGGEAPEWLEVLAHISLLITTLFLIEIPLNLWAFGRQHMNPFGPVPHAALHAFDTFVILTTFILEVVLRGSERELAGLLVILRLWRLVKLVGGVAIGAGELEEENARILAGTRNERDHLKAELEASRQENEKLRKQLGLPNTGVQDIPDR